MSSLCLPISLCYEQIDNLPSAGWLPLIRNVTYSKAYKIYLYTPCIQIYFVRLLVERPVGSAYRTLLCWVAQDLITLWPKAPDFALNHIFYYFIVKFILWYLLKMSDPFFKNENSVFRILIHKYLEQKITFVPWKWGLLSFKEGKSNFFRLNLDNDYWNHFLYVMYNIQDFFFILFVKRLALKAADSPLYLSPYLRTYFVA